MFKRPVSLFTILMTLLYFHLVCITLPRLYANIPQNLIYNLKTVKINRRM